MGLDDGWGQASVESRWPGPDRKGWCVRHRLKMVIVRSRCNPVARRFTPASKGDNAATTSRARLIRFYRRFGFKIEDGPRFQNRQTEMRRGHGPSGFDRKPEFTSAQTRQTVATA